MSRCAAAHADFRASLLPVPPDLFVLRIALNSAATASISTERAASRRSSSRCLLQCRYVSIGLPRRRDEEPHGLPVAGDGHRSFGGDEFRQSRSEFADTHLGCFHFALLVSAPKGRVAVLCTYAYTIGRLSRVDRQDPACASRKFATRAAGPGARPAQHRDLWRCWAQHREPRRPRHPRQPPHRHPSQRRRWPVGLAPVRCRQAIHLASVGLDIGAEQLFAEVDPSAAG